MTRPSTNVKLRIPYMMIMMIKNDNDIMKYDDIPVFGGTNFFCNEDD